MKLFIFFLVFTTTQVFGAETVFIKNDKTKAVLKKCSISFNKYLVETINLNEAQTECLENSALDKVLEKADYFLDAPIEMIKNKSVVTSKEDEKVYALAKKEFGLPQFLKEYPTYDGRNVITGVIDDGISPHHSGFKTTTTGQRKYIGHFSHSTAYTFPLIQNESATINFEGSNFKPDYLVLFDENKYNDDFNDDGKKSEHTFAVMINEKGAFFCHDLDLNGIYENKDCKRSFSTYNEYSSWTPKRIVPLMAEINLDEKTLQINEGEWEDDSHGEGVASVMAGHNLFGSFNGVAPGAQILDYDLSETSFIPHEKVYTIGTFLKGITILAEHGAEVINMSYSFYFHSAASQKAMSKALEALIDHYNVLLVFSGGNNGPGLGSMNRSLIYPRHSLVAGAFISKEMDSLVHGASGIDEQGQVVYYSSLGPGSDFGMGPTVISPLASITHSDAESPARSFSGTSSAAPALAGISTVLISAIKQEGLPVDVASVVAAIKLSGKKLTDTPYIFQGFGLPQIDVALKKYKEVLNGSQPKISIIGSSEIEQRDGITSMGKVVRLEDAPQSEEIRISVYGEFNFDQATFEDQQILKLVDLEYSHEWLNGPTKTWYSHKGGAQFSLTTNYELLDKNKNEHFGEVRVLDFETKDLLAVFPITVIGRPIFKSPIKQDITLSPEKAHRIHFKASEVTNGLQLGIDLTSLVGGRVTYRLYNKDGVVEESGSVMGGDELNVDYSLNPGEDYQLAFSRYRGNQDLSFSVKLKPIMLKNKTISTETTGSVLLQNLGLTTIEGHLNLEEVIEPKFKGFVKSENNMSFKFNYTISEVGSYSVELKSPILPDLTYFSSSCYQSKKSSEGDNQLVGDILLVNDEEELDTTVAVECFVFDLAPGVSFSKGFEYQVFNASEGEDIISSMLKLNPKVTTVIDTKKIDLAPGLYKVFFETRNEGKIDLGRIQIY